MPRAIQDISIGNIFCLIRSKQRAANGVFKIDAVMSVRSTDKMEDWVLIWGAEYITKAAGKVDYMGQYRRALLPSKK